jgi:hypothetical protein
VIQPSASHGKTIGLFPTGAVSMRLVMLGVGVLIVVLGLMIDRDRLQAQIP